MTGHTHIQWTDLSSNPLRFYDTRTGKRGWFCVHASAGCANCYSEAMNRWVGNLLPYQAQQSQHVRVELNHEELRSWQRLKPGTKVFPFDMTDLFMDLVKDQLLDDVMSAMATSPATFQILTKRAARMASYVEDWHRRTLTPVLRNVWWGVSAEDQANADMRVPKLLSMRHAALRWVSYEPALGPIDFSGWLYSCDGDCNQPAHPIEPNLDWIVYGGESGPRARPNDIGWARSTRDQCAAAGCAFFCKQFGARPTDVARIDAEPVLPGDTLTSPDLTPDQAARLVHLCEVGTIHLKDRKGGDPAEWPAGDWPREFPEARA